MKYKKKVDYYKQIDDNIENFYEKKIKKKDEAPTEIVDSLRKKKISKGEGIFKEKPT